MRGVVQTARTMLLCVVAACAGDPSGPPPAIESLPRALSTDERAIVAASNGFAFGLLREAAARADGPNVVLSPLSASMALGMALNGAAGATYDEMRAALGFDGMANDDINVAYRDLTVLLTELDPQVEITIANSTWARADFPFLPSFFATVEQYFDAEARTLDFSRPDAKDVINGWVAERTRGRIESIIDAIDANDVMFLLNAVYFRASWRSRFDAAQTADAPFRRDDGASVTVPMMTAADMPVRLAYADGAQIAELPYGGGAFAMVVVLPPEGTPLSAFVAGLDDATWTRWTAGLGALRDVPVAMPRYEIDYDETLNETLQALGMRLAFVPDVADFSRLSAGGGLYVEKVRQKTWLRVDEQGTEAAAATSVGIRVTSAPVGIRLDRPFLMVIRERYSGTILFVGAIGDPR